MEERFEPELYKVFVLLDEQKRITAINSSSFIDGESGGGWTEVLLP